MMTVRTGLLAAALAVATGCSSAVAGRAAFDLGPLEPDCPNQTSVATVRPVADVLLRDSAHGLPTDLDNSGPQSLEDIVKVYDADDQAAVRRELTSAGFVEDHDQVWSTGSYTDDTRRAELIQLYRFRTPQGACRYFKAAAARALLKQTSSAIPGTYGSSYDGTVLNSASLQATKGPYYLVASALGTKESVQGWPATLLQAQFDRL